LTAPTGKILPNDPELANYVTKPKPLSYGCRLLFASHVGYDVIRKEEKKAQNVK